MGWTAGPTIPRLSAEEDSLSDFTPGFTLSGPIIKDKVWFFLGFNPWLQKDGRSVDFGNNGGLQHFSQNTQTYYTTARIDASLSERVRVFGSWLYQYQRRSGEALPDADSTSGLYNVSTSIPVFAFSHDLGYSAPNSTTNFGADFTLNQRMIATTRFGYYFENYHDFGYPTDGNLYFFEANGVGGSDINGNPLPANLQQPSGYFNAAQNQNYTVRNANKHIQFDQDFAWFKSGWGGTHNFKFGYQLNRASNDIFQRYNEPATQIFPGNQQFYFTAGSTGVGNCEALVAANGPAYGDGTQGSNCTGTYGYAVVQDYGSFGKATSYNHAFFVQDSWTIGHGVTVNAGLRIEKENLPGDRQGVPPEVSRPSPFSLAGASKIAPRVGAAWDVFHDGRMKVFGSYGVLNDVMKLNLAISSFGGQYWQNCAYALMTPDYANALNIGFEAMGAIAPVIPRGERNSQVVQFRRDSTSRRTPTSVVPNPTCTTATPTGRVAPNLNLTPQHETDFGVDYALSPHWRSKFVGTADDSIRDRRLCSSKLHRYEIFTIVNPGRKTRMPAFTNPVAKNRYYPKGDSADSNGNNPNIKPARSYDGVEIRLTKSWAGIGPACSPTPTAVPWQLHGLTSSDTLGRWIGWTQSPNNSRCV